MLASKDRYFLITKDPITMKSILVDDGFDPGEVKTVIIGPCNDRPGATKLGNNQAITQPEADALEAIMQKGYEVEFALNKEAAIGNWKKFRGQFGYSARFHRIKRKEGELMQVQVWQAALFGLLACLASMPGLGGTVFGNYTLGRPLVAGLIVGLIMGDVQTGIYLGAAIQVVYIALVTPGGTVSADVRAISYIGIPLSMVAVHSMGLNPASPEGQAMAVTLGSAVGTIGTVLFYGTATVNLVWQHMGWRALEKGDLRKLYVVDMGLPWISHILCSFIPTFIITKVGTSMVDLMKAYLPMDGVAMKTLFTVGSLLPAVGIAILLKQVATKPVDILVFVFGFTLAACMGLNLIAASIVGGFFAVINYRIKILALQKAAPAAASAAAAEFDDDEEEI